MIYLPKSRREIVIDNQLISLRKTRDALQDAFTINIIEETSHGLRAKIVRFARLYGAPVIWPCATIEVLIHNDDNKIVCTYCWPDYYMLIFVGFLLILVNTTADKPPIILNFAAPIFYGALIYLDALYVMSRIKRYILNAYRAT